MMWILLKVKASLLDSMMFLLCFVDIVCVNLGTGVQVLLLLSFRSPSQWT